MIFIKLQSYNSRLINNYIKFLKKEASLFNIVLEGPVFLPKNTKRFTVIRSPHVFSKSKEQFELKVFKYLLKVNISKNSKLNFKFFQKFLINNIISGIGLKITIK